MSGWAVKRFWTRATPEAVEGGWGVLLDARALRTPGKRPFVVPTRALAQAVADEWDAQTATVQPATMPHTRTVNSAIDTVAVQRPQVVEMLAAYADADLTCYRADGPAGLVARQSARWDPLIDWCAATHGARLSPRTGVMHAPQDAQALARLHGVVDACDPFVLAGLHELVSLSGSLVIGLAALAPAFPRDALWEAACTDESWQAEVWGIDAEAAERAATRRTAFLQAGAFVDLLAG
ncbi:MAG: ATPase [Rhodobacteraceae bacterium]|jgi:chaperone required for assembly of F1-ATPase|nr:ATPase [Paracoccaceae bacterium]